MDRRILVTSSHVGGTSPSSRLRASGCRRTSRDRLFVRGLRSTNWSEFTILCATNGAVISGGNDSFAATAVPPNNFQGVSGADNLLRKEVRRRN